MNILSALAWIWSPHSLLFVAAPNPKLPTLPNKNKKKKKELWWAMHRRPRSDEAQTRWPRRSGKTCEKAWSLSAQRMGVVNEWYDRTARHTCYCKGTNSSFDNKKMTISLIGLRRKTNPKSEIQMEEISRFCCWGPTSLISRMITRRDIPVNRFIFKIR